MPATYTHDQADLHKIALSDGHYLNRAIAIDKLNDQSVLVQIADDKDKMIRFVAAQKLTDRSVLTRLSKQDPVDYVRRAARDRLAKLDSATAKMNRETDHRAPVATRSEYVIPEFANGFGDVDSSTDAMISMTDKPGVYRFAGKTDVILPSLTADALVNNSGKTININAEPNNWGPGARHTMKGKIVIAGHVFLSSAEDPLVFKAVRNRGYVYERGKGTVITPRGGKIHLASARPGSAQQTENQAPEKLTLFIEDSAGKRYAEMALLLLVDTVFGGGNNGDWVVRNAQIVGPSGLAKPVNGETNPAIAVEFVSPTLSEVDKQRLLFPLKDGTLTLNWKAGKPASTSGGFVIPFAALATDRATEIPMSQNHPAGAVQITFDKSKAPLGFFMQFKGRLLASVGFEPTTAKDIQ